MILTAWDMHISRRLVQRFPGHPYILGNMLYLAKDKLVVSYNLRDSQHWTVDVWDLTSNLVRKVGEFSNLGLLHVGTDEDVLVAFEVNWKTNPPEVQQTKWNLMTRELLGKKQSLLPLPDHVRAANDARIVPRSGVYRHTLDHKTVSELIVAVDNAITLYLLLTYDHAVDELSARWMNYPPSFYRPGSMVSRTVFPTPNVVYYWDEDARQPAVYDMANSTTTFPPNYQLDSRMITGRLSQAAWLQHIPKEQLYRQMLLFGDREVVGFAGLGGVELWLFNPEFTPNLADVDEGVWTTKPNMSHQPANTCQFRIHSLSD